MRRLRRRRNSLTTNHRENTSTSCWRSFWSALLLLVAATATTHPTRRRRNNVAGLAASLMMVVQTTFLFVLPSIGASFSSHQRGGLFRRRTRREEWTWLRNSIDPTSKSASQMENLKETPLVLFRRNQTADLWSVLHTLHRTRKLRRQDDDAIDHHHNNNGGYATASTCQPAYSLVHYLSTNTFDGNDNDDNDSRDVEIVLSRVVVQGIRLASSNNDYKLILKLVDASVQFANSKPLIQPRILGEAISELTKTSVNIGKIKSVWNQLLLPINDTTSLHDTMGRPPYLTTQFAAMEVNAMLKALTSRGKIRAALEFFRDSLRVHRVDSYSLSIIFDGLTSSIDNHPPTAIPNSIPSLCLQRFRSMVSPCWQWNEAISILDSLASESPTSSGYLNNYNLALLFKLNIRAGEVFRSHNAARHSLICLDWIKDRGIRLDNVSCTLLISGLRSNWKDAISILQQMKNNNYCANSISNSTFPRPNVYTYTAVITACARSGQYETAIGLLHELKDTSNCNESTAVYNAVLQSLATKSHLYERRSRHKVTKRLQRDARHRIQLAMQLLFEMKDDAAHGMETLPDQVTYNTVLATLRLAVQFLEAGDLEELLAKYEETISPSSNSVVCSGEMPLRLIAEMREGGFSPNELTYIHALGACTSVESILQILNHASSTLESWPDSKTRLLNTALPHAASCGGMTDFVRVLDFDSSTLSEIDPETTTQIIVSLGRCEKTRDIPVLLQAMTSHQTGKESWLRTELGKYLSQSSLPILQPCFVEAGIKSCLRANDLSSAQSIIRLMEQLDITISPIMLQEVGRMYAIQYLAHQNNAYQPNVSCAMTEPAVKAYNICRSIDNPPTWLSTITSKALASAGLFDFAGDVMLHAHESAIHFHGNLNPATTLSRRDTSLLKDLHVTLLRSTARFGNVTAAVRFCREIQSFAGKVSTTDVRLNIADNPISLAMSNLEWKLLLVAAMKSGHWKVCLSTLQFLKPRVEALQPSAWHTNSQARQVEGEYVELSAALNIAMKCLAAKGQYGWIIRVLDDWIKWSCRRPPKQSVFIAIQALCEQRRGVELGSLLARCLMPSPIQPAREGSSYEVALFVFAVTTLYNDGLYDTADDIFLTAVRSYALPFDLRDDASDPARRVLTLDLHGMNLAVAHSAVRTAFHSVAQGSDFQPERVTGSDLVIVTGRGRSSALRMRPILRPEVQRMLVEEFYPPLSSYSIPGNMGAIRVPAADVHAWLVHQTRAKQLKFMAVAAVLRKISSDAVQAAMSLSGANSKEV